VESDTYIGAGSTITKKVPNGALAIARTKQVNIDGWVDKKGLRKK
jgi:bifunctional UDP-N-acetylglucosamine pyrophosphorylase/glucosamine-1-phosphate N-acetyltransferase